MISNKKLDLDKYLEAYTYSYKLHKKQMRKGSNIPYFTHLSSVSNLIIENNGTTTQAIAGLLHDAVEDQGGVKTLKVIRTKFGSKVATIVKECSDSVVEPKPPWSERKKKYLSDIKKKTQSSMFVSLCDKLHNGTCIIDDHKRVGKKLWKRFTASPKDIAWYYESLYKEFNRHLKGHKVLKDNYYLVVKEIKRIAK